MLFPSENGKTFGVASTTLLAIGELTKPARCGVPLILNDARTGYVRVISYTHGQNSETLKLIYK